MDIRTAITLIENAQTVSPDRLTAAIKNTIEKWLSDGVVSNVREIGNGHCYDFTSNVMSSLGLQNDYINGTGSVKIVRTEDFEKDEWFADLDYLRSLGEPVPGDIPAADLARLIGEASHEWMFLQGKHYDATAPDGVRHFLDLPFFKDQIDGLRRDISASRAPTMESMDRVYDWTAPITLYRGSGRGNPNPFADTDLGYPTFTDVPLIAKAYALRPNSLRQEVNGGRVFAYRVKLARPLLLFDGHPEPVTEINYLQRVLDLSDAEAIALVRTIPEWHQPSGPVAQLHDEEILAVLHGDDDYLYDNNISISSYHLAKDTRIQNRAKMKGYDALILRGPFNGSRLNAVLDSSVEAGTHDGSYELGYALEWMIFNPARVKLIGETTDQDLGYDALGR